MLFIKKFLLCLNLLIVPCVSNLRAEMLEEEHPVVILGGGVAAMTAGTYLARGGLSPVIITGPFIGGTIIQSQNVQNWPGEISISGLDLSDKVKNQAEANGAVLQAEIVVSVDLSKRPFIITTKKIFGSAEQFKRY